MSVRPAAAPVRDLQALDRSAVCREDAQCRWALPGAAHPRPGSLRGREILVQTLERTQPLLPLRPGQARRRTQAYAWHGTTSLCASPNVKVGTANGQCYLRHRSSQLRCLLEETEAAVPAYPNVHLVLDNLATHKTKLMRVWLPRTRTITCISSQLPPLGSIRSIDGSAL